jgi:hypothetical protein
MLVLFQHFCVACGVPEMKETAPERDRAESITAALASRLDLAAVAEEGAIGNTID